MTFQQEDFTYRCLVGESSFIEDLVKALAEPNHVETIMDDLSQFSPKTLSEALPLMWQAEKNQPQLVQYDHWGQRIDRLDVDPAWNSLHQFSAREKVIATGYERKCGADSRLHQFLKLMIFHPSSAFYTCPLAMTDGAARVLELTGGELKEKFFAKLTSGNPDEFWTAGQWMTEKAGGSDVSQSETFAEMKDGKYYLHGVKWFTSAITANIAMTLAQTPVGDKNRLSLFLVEIRKPNGELNNIEVLRLKDKLGTKAMPTAELKLNGVEGHLIGELGQGVKNIATVLNISRLYNAVCATGTLYRLQSLIRDYSQKRQAFGKKLIDHPLHQQTLLSTQASSQACILFISELAKLLGKNEVDSASDQEKAVLRLFTPVAKLWTAKQALSGVSELVEAFGGAGYIEDTQLPRFLRDVQVFPIWEGTTNIMSLDTLRALSKRDNFSQAMTWLKNQISGLDSSQAGHKEKVEEILHICSQWLKDNQGNPQVLELGARRLATSLGDILCATLMLRFASHTEHDRDQILADHFIASIVKPHFLSGSEGRVSKAKETILS